MVRAAIVAMFVLLHGSAGCSMPDETPPETSDTSAPNSCTGIPAPMFPRENQDAVRGANAYDFMVGLVCDHSGATPLERPRVPGTPGHAAGVTYLASAITKTGFAVRYQNFTGNDYEQVMEANMAQAVGYDSYYTRCKGTADFIRMRGLSFTNIEARGGTLGGPILLFMAHWDSKRFATSDPDPANRDKPVLGANDGASGVGVLLELARVLKKQTTPFEVRMFFTDGEDGFDDCHPLAGSTVYAEQLENSAAERNRLRGIVLLDMVGHPTAAFRKGCGQDSQLTEKIWAIAARLDVGQFKQQFGCGGVDDHTPFENRAMRGVDVIDGQGPVFAPGWHTVHDTPEILSADLLGRVGRVLHTLVQEMTV